MMGFGHGMMGGGFSIIFWILIIVIIYYFFKESKQNNHNNYRNDDSAYNRNNNFDRDRDRFKNQGQINSFKNEGSAEDIARKRYAKGEITKEELKEILANLNE